MEVTKWLKPSISVSRIGARLRMLLAERVAPMARALKAAMIFQIDNARPS